MKVPEDEHDMMDDPSGADGRLRRRFLRRKKKRRPRFSSILNDLAGDETRDRISVGDILAAMGDRAFGALMLVFALPNAIPTPPGTSAILGAPLIFLAAQMTFGRKPWLPQFVAARSMARGDFAALVARLGPWLSRAERLLKPRLSGLALPPAEYVIGFVCLVLSLILVLPIPFGNMLPAIAISVFAFGILERDGVWVIAAALLSILSITVAAGVVFALIKALIFVVTNALASSG
jgi:hypothetical protein